MARTAQVPRGEEPPEASERRPSGERMARDRWGRIRRKSRMRMMRWTTNSLGNKDTKNNEEKDYQNYNQQLAAEEREDQQGEYHQKDHMQLMEYYTEEDYQNYRQQLAAEDGEDQQGEYHQKARLSLMEY